MDRPVPLVSFGLAAYNEGPFIRETLDQLLAQTYPSLEILIADNGSDDDTQQVCEEYAAKHANIIYVRHPRNIGQNANFNYLARSASGTYFCWMAAHDLLDKDFVQKCVDVLEAHPACVLAHGKAQYVTTEGAPVMELSRHFDIAKMDPLARFRETMWRVDCNYVYGMWRLAPMLESHLFRYVPAADRVFLSEMAVKGTFLPVNTYKYYRINRGAKKQTEMEKRHRLMRYIFPRRTYTDAELAGNDFYAPTMHAMRTVAADAGFSWIDTRRALWSVWLCSIAKFHLFPGADALSRIVKAIMPGLLMKRILGRMQ